MLKKGLHDMWDTSMAEKCNYHPWAKIDEEDEGEEEVETEEHVHEHI